MLRIGWVLRLIAFGHVLVGLALFHAPLGAMVRDGVFDSISPHLLRDGLGPNFDRAAAFWFLLFSPVLFLCGQIADRAAEQRDGRLLSLLGWHLLAIGVVGVIVMPISGFWTLLGVAPFLLGGARRVAPL